MKNIILITILSFSSVFLMKPNKFNTIECIYKDNILTLREIDTQQVLIEKEDSRIFIKDIENLNEEDDYIQFKKNDKNVIYSLKCKNVI